MPNPEDPLQKSAMMPDSAEGAMTRKILVVDDERDYTVLLSDILTAHGYEVGAAYDGRQAMEMISKDKPDLIILDVKMPGLDGFEVGKLLSSDERYRDIPFLMLTASNDFDNIKLGLGVGAVSYIVKPFKQAVLLALVDGLLSKKPSTQQSTDT